MVLRIAQRSVLYPNASLSVVGYGLTENDETGQRLQAAVPVFSWYCAERWAQGRDCESFSELMLSELGHSFFRPDGNNPDICGGDRGGPAFAITIEGEEQGKVKYQEYLVAITSRGMHMNRGEVDPDKRCGGGGNI